MNEQVKNLLEKCNEAYSNGEIYIIKDYEIEPVEKEFNIKLPTLFVDDDLYDLLYYCAKEKWPEDPFFNKLTSNNTGYGVDITHKYPAGSMTELKRGEWDKWKVNHDKYLVSEKLDGCSLILTYTKGRLTMAATRGDGLKGKDVLRHIIQVTNIPHILPTGSDVTVRGELVCPKQDIQKMLKELENLTGQAQKNGRNTIAGALNRKETNIVVFRYAHFVAYWDSIEEGRSFNTLITYGFETPKQEIIDNKISEDDLIVKTTNWINDSKYELDGLILTQYGENTDKGFDTGTINPKQSKKWKISNIDTSKETVVTDIIWQLGKSGKYTPVLVIEPIELSGALVYRVTGSNYENVINQHCGIGAKIVAKRAGDVIPYLVKVLETSDNFNIPQNSVVKGVDLFTHGDEDAENSINIKRLEFFAKSLDIEQLGEKNCAEIYWNFYGAMAKAMVPEDIFDKTFFTEEKFVEILGKNGEKLYKSLEAKRNNLTEVELASACNSFGIGIAKKILQSVYDKYDTLEVSESQIEQMEGFGGTRTAQYIANINAWKNTKDTATNNGIIFKKLEKKNNTSGICVCFSGIRDKEFAKQLQDMGIEVSDSFTNKVTHLIVKDVNEETSKIKKAKERKCSILSLMEAKQKMTAVNM